MQSSPALLEWLWFFANLVTGAAYMHIPYEITQWAKGVDLRGMYGVGAVFVAFIVFCGAHHLSMLRFFGQHPVDEWQVGVDVAMATVSGFASYVLFKNRERIKVRLAVALRGQ